MVAAFSGFDKVASAVDGTSEAYRKAWSDPTVIRRINDGIEHNRKGDVAIEVVDGNGAPIPNASLEIRQKTHAFLFGCNAFALGQLKTPELNRKYEESFAHLFNFATAPFYWRDLEPQAGKLRFEEGSAFIWRRPPPDQVVNWCKSHEIAIKGHALMYSKNMFMPDWVNRNDPENLKVLSQKHMAEIAQRYGRDIAVWDVVNEEIPRLASPSEWCAVPNDYLAWCFDTAGRVFPKQAKMMINDGTEQAHVTTAKYAAMIQGLLQRQVRVEGIGMQFHNGNYGPKAMFATYDRLGQLGLPLYITEITISGVGKDGPATQAAIVANLYRLWFSTPAMAGITWWNLADGTAFENENKALGGLIDKNMNAKPAYQALDRLINHEWRTNLAVKTDATGKSQFRGFYGKYAVKVTFGNTTKNFTVDIQKDAQTSHRLVVNP